MRIIVAVVFATLCFSSWGETLVVRTPSQSVTVKPVIKKAKLLRSNPHRYTAINFAGVNPWDAIDDEDILPQRRYRFELKDDIEELSEHVRFRLWLARQLAMKKFAETHSCTV